MNRGTPDFKDLDFWFFPKGLDENSVKFLFDTLPNQFCIIFLLPKGSHQDFLFMEIGQLRIQSRG